MSAFWFYILGGFIVLVSDDWLVDRYPVDSFGFWAGVILVGFGFAVVSASGRLD